MKTLVAGLTAGVVTAVIARGESLVTWPQRVRTVFPGVVGGIVAVSTVALTSIPRIRAHHTPFIAVGAVTVGSVGWLLRKNKLAGIELEGAALDPGLSDPPKSVHVSGGPGSEVNYSQISREGARFVHSVVTSPELDGFDRGLEPIRVFVSVLNAPTIAARVDMAIRELQRTGAFERKYLLVQSPAGSGYANSTPVDVLELLSGGDCATVVVSYGLLPSFLSLSKVATAGETQRELLVAINMEIESRNRQGKSVPQLLLYGESLGAKVQQYALPLGLVDLDRFHISRALWVGTPGGVSSDGFHQMCASDSITVDRPEQIPDNFDARVWFLEHDGDPVVRFRPDLSWTQPEWLSQTPRGRNIPESMTWKPGLTWATVLVDTVFATNVKPGDFQSWGHDYRADIGEVAARAFGFSPDQAHMAQMQIALRKYEVARAQRVLTTL